MVPWSLKMIARENLMISLLENAAFYVAIVASWEGVKYTAQLVETLLQLN